MKFSVATLRANKVWKKKRIKYYFGVKMAFSRRQLEASLYIPHRKTIVQRKLSSHTAYLTMHKGIFENTDKYVVHKVCGHKEENFFFQL